MTQPEPRPTLATAMKNYRGLGDPLADAVVHQVYSGDGDPSVRRVVELLNDIIDLEALPTTDAYGPAYTTYLAESLTFPEWYDPERTDESVDWFRSYGWSALAVLGCGSLPAGYSIPEVSNVLGTTQALARHIKRRLWETAQFVIQVMEHDGIVRSETDPTQAAGPGALRAQKVRLFHSIVRFLLDAPAEAKATGLAAVKRSDDEPMPYGELLWERRWNPEWGVPIHQAHMGGTILVFSWAILQGLRVLGFLGSDDISAEQEAAEKAFMYRWNLIGHFMGLDPDLMQWDYESGRDFIMSLDVDPNNPHPQPVLSNDLPELLNSLVSYMKSEVPGWLWFLRPTAPILMYILLEDEDGQGNRADRINLPIKPWEKRFAPLQRASMRAYAWIYNRFGILQRLNMFMYDRLIYQLIGPRPGGDRRMVRLFAPEPRRWRT